MDSVITIEELWHKATVWVLPKKSDLVWLAGIIATLQVIEEQWRFEVCCCNGESYIILTRPMDANCTEFELVKRRDESVLTSGGPVTDMTSLMFLNEPEMLNCIERRFVSKHIYTGIGPILVAVNPFERLSIYGEEIADSYFAASTLAESKSLGPHVYYLSDSAYRSMFINKYDPDRREDQVILVNGESGSGKTESTKLVLQYLSRVSSKVLVELDDPTLMGNDVENAIGASNPITESFGNAKTSRNNNSSRFGKIIDLMYAGDGYIEGASICTYMLETVRVPFQQQGERNYHVFYEMFAGVESAFRQEWGLSGLDAFRYTNQSGEYNRHDGESDEENYRRLERAMKDVGLDNVDKEMIFRIIAGILHLGNVTFAESTESGSDAATFSPQSADHLKQVCCLLGVSECDMLIAMSKRSFLVAGCEIHKSLNVESAASARDAMAKTLYDMMFKWMVNAVNETLYTDSGLPASTIAVLDIFGFEYFQINSFEQLCINYANEKLQDHFNYATFESRQEMYLEEGLQWTVTNYPDNSERLDMFEHKTNGIFALCDEQLKIAKPTDEKLLNVLYARCAQRTHFSASMRDQSHKSFTLHHFACAVTYSISGFLDKNKSEIAHEINACIANTSNRILHEAVALSIEELNFGAATPSPRRRSSTSSVGRSSAKDAMLQRKHSGGPKRQSVGKKSHTVASQFAKQLTGLVRKIRTSRSHFIRCVKPNMKLQPRLFEYAMVLSQLRCGGALDAIQVFRAGFPNRMDFSYFVTRYSTFLCICGVNAITRDMFQCMQRAQHSGSDFFWRISASRLIDIVKLTANVLNVIENAQLPDDVDILSGLQLGKTGVFLRATVYEYLERLHHASVTVVARRLQRRWRAQRLAKATGSGSVQQFHAISALMYFSDHKKRRVRIMLSATVLLQRRSRVLLAVVYKRRIVRGMTLIQARFRGQQGRLLVHNMLVNAASVIQSYYRGHAAKRDYTKAKQAVLIIQRNIRGKLARALKTRVLWSILLLQRVWRGCAGRLMVEAIRVTLRQAVLEEERRKEEARSFAMKLLESRLQDNPNLLDDMEAASETLRGLREEVSTLSTSLLSAEGKSALLQTRLSEKESTVTQLESRVADQCEYKHAIAGAASRIGNVSKALLQELSASPILGCSGAGECVNDLGDNVSDYLRDEDVLPTLEASRDNLSDVLILAAEMIKQRQETSMSVQQLQRDLTGMRDENRRISEENASMTNTIDALKNVVTEQQDAAESERSGLAAKVATLSNRLLQVQQDLTLTEEENCRVKEGNLVLSAKLDTLRSDAVEQLAAVESDRRRVVEELAALKDRYSELHDTNEELLVVATQLREKVRTSVSEIDTLSSVKLAYEELEKETNTKQYTILSLEKRCASLEEDIQTKITKESSLVLNLSSLEAHSSALEATKVNLEAEIKKVHSDLDNMAAHCRESASELKAQVEESTSSKHELACELDDLKQSADLLRTEKESLQTRIRKLEQLLSTHSGREDELNAQISQLKNRFDASERARESLKQNLYTMENDHSVAAQSLQLLINEGREREAVLEARVEQLNQKLSDGLFSAIEKKYLRLQIEYESLLNKYTDLQGHFKHEISLSELVKNVESCRGDVTRRRDRWKLPLTTTVERWIRFSEQEVVFIISVGLKDISAAAFNTMAANEKYAEFEPLLDANSSVILSEFPAVYFTAYSPFEDYLETRASVLCRKLEQINCQLSNLPAQDRLGEIPRYTREVSEFCGVVGKRR